MLTLTSLLFLTVTCLGETVLPAGRYTVTPITAGCTLRGESQADVIVEGGLTILSSASPVVVSNLTVEGTLTVSGESHQLDHLRVNAPGEVGVHFLATSKTVLRDSFVVSGIGVLIEHPEARDWGDNVITGNAIKPETVGVLWHSGGGLRVTNNKIIFGTSGVQLEPLGTPPPEQGTYAGGIFIISNNSIEAQTTRNIRIIRTVPLVISQVVITGNQINNAPMGVAVGDNTGEAWPWWLQGLVVTGNTFRGHDVGVKVNQAAGVTVKSNVFLMVAQPVSILPACPGVSVD